ncbi:MAG: FemAB family XrtA/PEP-CTERM system-associated protein [Burkholderiales bacterium]
MSQPLAIVDELPCAQLQVRELSAPDFARWDTFVRDCPDASFFHLSGWKTVIERAFGHRTYFLYAESEGKIAAVLSLAEIRSRLFGHSLSSLPFCVYGGVAGGSEEAKTALDSAAEQLALAFKVDYLEYRNRSPRRADWQKKDLYVTFRKEIDRDPDKNLARIPRKQRAMVRKGIAAGLRSELDDDVTRFFAAYSESVHRLGTPVFAKRYFATLREVFGQACEVLTVTQQGKLVASVLSFYFRDEVLPYYAGGVERARGVAGNDFMYWELMRRASERGVRVFDYGRSKLGTGSFDFKKNWGFTPEPLFYEYRLYKGKSVPEVNPLNPRYRMLSRLWRKLPLQLANCIGPHIVKDLG